MTKITERNKATALEFFKALEAEDPSHVARLFAENGIHINPYHSGIFPEEVSGRSEIKSYWTNVFPVFDGMTFQMHEIYAMEREDIVFTSFSGRIKRKQNAGWYENNYYATFRFNEKGEISEYVEIFNPVVAARGFNLLDKLVDPVQP